MTPNHQNDQDEITLGERVATAFVSAIAAALTLLGYFVIMVAFASKAPSGPPKLLFELFASKISVGFIVVASLLGFILGSSKMANVFADLWGTSEREASSTREIVIVVLVIVVAVAAITHFAYGG